MSITPEEFKLLAAYIFKISGITLDKSKGYLVETRLKPLLKKYQCQTFQDLYEKSQFANTAQLTRDIVDAISTNETFFFRDTKPFDLLRHKIIPELIDHRRTLGMGRVPIRIWSAACSTGQEVYSIAMTLLEMLPDIQNYDISILGTDISAKALKQASNGSYNSFEMQRGLPEAYRQKYFNKHNQEWRIKDNVRILAQFQKLNLLQDMQELQGMDIVFCRNVAIYFSPTDKKKLFTNIAGVMARDGVLIVGGSETMTNFTSLFTGNQHLKTIFYTQQQPKTKAPVSAPRIKKVPVLKKNLAIKPLKTKIQPITKRKANVLTPKQHTNPKQPVKPLQPKKKTSLLANLSAQNNHKKINSSLLNKIHSSKKNRPKNNQ